MSTELTVPSPEVTALAIVPDEIKAQFVPAKQAWRMAEISGKQAIAFALRTGHLLVELKKKLSVKRGGDRKSKDATPALKWEDTVQAEMGFSDEWARKLMTMALKAKTELPDNLIEGLMSRPALAWTDEDLTTLTAAMSERSDASSITDLMHKWGVVKKSSRDGSPNPNGPGELPPDTRTPEQQAQDAVWKFQDGLGTFVQRGHAKDFVRLLPLQIDKNNLGKNTGCLASLMSLKPAIDSLQKWIDATIKERQQSKPKKAAKSKVTKITKVKAKDKKALKNAA